MLRGASKLCRQYLKWFGNASHRPERNGEFWLLRALGNQSIGTIFDVGANVGKWSLAAAEAFPEATIYAFEIVPATATELCKRVAGHDRVRCMGFGLAERTGVLRVRYNPAASSHSTFTDYPHGWRGEQIECPVMRGDEFLAREAIAACDFLKLDVEGAEHLVLQGFGEHLQGGRVRFVQFEYGRVNILTRFLLKDFYELFTRYGYAVGKIFPDYVEFRDYDLSDEDFLGPNYFACRQDDPVVHHLGHP
jgi:FkbM family methyltransferase